MGWVRQCRPSPLVIPWGRGKIPSGKSCGDGLHRSLILRPHWLLRLSIIGNLAPSGSSFWVHLEENSMVKSDQLETGSHSLLDRDESHDDGPYKRMRAVGHVELLEDGSQVILGCLGADVQPLRNLAVRRALSQELQDLEFTLSQ